MIKRKTLDYIFILLEIILYILIFTISSSYIKYVSYLSIVLVFCYSLTFFKYSKNTEFRLIQLGLFATMIADLFLIVINDYKSLAMVSFSITQLSYAFYLLSKSKNKVQEMIIRGVGSIFTILFTLWILKEKTDFLSLISTFYFFNLLLNIVFSFINKSPIIFKIGLILFACCDFLIGLENAINNYITIDNSLFIYQILNLDINLAWVFYLPSQVLISLSLKYILENKKTS